MVAAFGGWNDAAAAASNAVVFVGERLGARRVAAIDPEDFYDFQATRPLVDLTSPTRTTIVWPEVEMLSAARARRACTTWCWWPAPSRRCAGAASAACCSRRPASSA